MWTLFERSSTVSSTSCRSPRFERVSGHKVAAAAVRADGFQPLLGLRRIAADQHHFGIGGGQPFGDGTAQFASAANDDGGLVRRDRVAPRDS